MAEFKVRVELDDALKEKIQRITKRIKRIKWKRANRYAHIKRGRR